MPVMDGYQATSQIREMPEAKHLPIIAMTANAMMGDKEKALDAGMNDHLAKPINISVMHETLSRWITAQPSDNDQIIENDETLEDDETLRKEYQALCEIAKLDLQAGLAGTMNNCVLYRRMLVMFYENQKTFDQQFNQACQDSDNDAAIRLSHTLKGTAGTIGATDLQQLAGELEQACIDHGYSSAVVESLLPKIFKENHRLICTLENQFLIGDRASESLLNQPDNEHTNGHDEQKGEPESLESLLQQLRRALEESDADAADYLDQLQQVLSSAQVVRCRPLIRAVEEFEFDQALELLTALEKTLD